jgi:hypothetical protein
MYISEDKVIEIFYLADNFCKEFDQAIAHYTLGNPAKKKARMSNSEVITIMVFFHRKYSLCFDGILFFPKKTFSQI